MEPGIEATTCNQQHTRPSASKRPWDSDFEEDQDEDNKPASNGGHGTDDTLHVTKVLEEHGIHCCLVGISALIFYGAARVRPVSGLNLTQPSINARTRARLLTSRTNNRTGKFVSQQSSSIKQQTCYNPTLTCKITS